MNTNRIKKIVGWKNFFFRITETELNGKVLLDLGCFTGGRITAWTKRYKLKLGLGLDINPVFKIASEEFATSHGISNIQFTTAFGENLPYADNSVDYIISTDVFEHVRNVEMVMNECYRVLKKGGKLCVVFPQYLQPFEAHLGMATNTPALHWFFSGKTISEAYINIINEREGSHWYAPENFPLHDWERLFALNGITIHKFKKILSQQKRSVVDSKIKPILTDGRRSRKLAFKLLSSLLTPLAYIPYFNEYFVGRVNYILTK
ncbi:class I SAM-dependent methyltransferase [Spirulina sp. CCNP1310]|uniref:class I SAM-dependent methyltransferase n=1 Tax=Spirulina sp. CCNP1310 TaxID=3110249 RepID=UPI002B205CD8|nr:class I SAM-dependent methyltransferase [Spirulina sp. CCNP1310]MEA5421447.1 class I SAM-dependent methyltransferase [Spirulina sp. CCNP1310]